MCRDLSDPAGIGAVLTAELNERKYLPGWWVGLWTQAGVPAALATANDMRREKAAGDGSYWMYVMRDYAWRRAGANITLVTGTWRESLVHSLHQILNDATRAGRTQGIGVEAVTKELARRNADLAVWQCRRIAQTEVMIGMAEASAASARDLDVPFTKQWCTSGLSNVRDSHQLVDGVVVDSDEPFELEGGLLMYPHDPNSGADPSEIINCACACIREPKAAEPLTAEEQAENDRILQELGEAGSVDVDGQGFDEERIAAEMAKLDSSLPEDVRKAQAVNNLALEKELGTTRGLPMSVEDADKQSANPNHVPKFIWDPKGNYRDPDGTRWRRNPEFTQKDVPYNINCATCAPAFVLRERGFNVVAKGNTPGTLNRDASRGGTSWEMWANADGSAAKPTMYKDWLAEKGYLQMSTKRYQQFYEETCKKEGDYIVTIGWKGRGGDGHATILRRGKDGVLSYIEPQEYVAEKGVYRNIMELCVDGEAKPGSKRGVLYVSDKIFKKEWAGLFRVE